MFNDKSGNRYGRWLVLNRATDDDIINEGKNLFKFNKLRNKKIKLIYFWCKCDCGNIKLVISQSLNGENSRSCGCLNNELKRAKNPRLSSAIIRYNQLYNDGDLSFDDFMILSQKKCFYCGADPSNRINCFDDLSRFDLNSYLNGEFIYNGLDRVDNTQPHNKNNIVPCCKFCNRAKSNLHINEFRDLINRIYINFIKNKQIIISHRGNIDGININSENNPDNIKHVLSLGFDVEIDLRIKDGKFYLGHDYEQYEVNKEFFFLPGLWIHAKNIEALLFITEYKEYLIGFYHNNDDCTLTTNKLIWTFPGKQLTTRSIAVLPERVGEWENIQNCFGICTDYPYKYKELYK